MLYLPVPPPTIRPLTNEESSRLNAETPDSFDPRGRCPTCRGRRQFRWYGYSGISSGPVKLDEIYDYQCSCVDQYMLYRFMLYSGIGLTYQRLSWRDLANPIPDTVQEYLDNIGRYVDAGMGLVLHGNLGNGKTLISALIAKAAIGAGIATHSNTFSEMLERFTSGWYDALAKEWYLRKVKNTTLLIIDDIGKEYRATKTTKEGVVSVPTGPAASLLDEVLRHRLAQALPTLITTNHPLQHLSVMYGEGGSIGSLLNERCLIHQFNGEDYRSVANARFKQEVKADLTRPIVL